MPPPVHALQRAKLHATDAVRDQLAARRYRRTCRELRREEQLALADLGSLALTGEVAGSPTFAQASGRVERVRRRLQLEHEFHERRPWVTRFEIGGVAYGGSFPAAADARIGQFHASFPETASILELGSLEGGHSFALAALPGVERVTALEGREANVARACFVQGVLADDSAANVEFAVADLEHDDLAARGRFDAVFCAGLLYHLPRPWELLSSIAAVSDHLFVWTQVASEPREGEGAGGYPGRSYYEYGLADPLSGLSPVSFWPTWDGLVAMLGAAGFAHVEPIEWGTTKRRGPAVTLSAVKQRP